MTIRNAKVNANVGIHIENKVKERVRLQNRYTAYNSTLLSARRRKNVSLLQLNILFVPDKNAHKFLFFPDRWQKMETNW